MNKELIDYINEPRNGNINFSLARWYEEKGHLAPAVSFYIRAAEFSEDVNLIYEALVRVFLCYDKAGERDITSETTLKQAISLCPRRPEAYFLLAQFYEYRQKWIDAYTFSCLAMDLAEKKYDVMPNTEYPGDYVFYFLRACSAWNLGKSDESRKIYHNILDIMVHDLNKRYKDLLQTNLSLIGVGSEKTTIRKYSKNKHRLKFDFDYLDKIEENYSQAYQDICAVILNEGKPGTYLEIGASKPFIGNNTALLELFEWNGIGVEIDENLVNEYNQQRKNKSIKQDALDCDYEKLILEILSSSDKNHIDYLQVDVEPSKNNFMTLVLLPFEKYKFKFITYEHDYYSDVYKIYREKSRRFLFSHGYELLINDVSPINKKSFEDWWYHPDLIDDSLLSAIKNVNMDLVHDVEEIFITP